MRNSTGNNSTLGDLLLCEDVSLETANSEEEKGEVAELDDFVGSSEKITEMNPQWGATDC